MIYSHFSVISIFSNKHISRFERAKARYLQMQTEISKPKVSVRTETFGFEISVCICKYRALALSNREICLLLKMLITEK